MFNPFVRFIPELVDAFLEHGERYLVSQTFRPGINLFTGERNVLMFSQYSDLGFAQIHLNAVKADPYAAIIDLHKEKHKTRVIEMLQPGSHYLVFSNLVRDAQAVEQVADKQYAHKLRRYIDLHTTWRISMNPGLRPKMQLIFGELFIVLRFGSQQLRVKFEDIENL